MKVNNTKVLKLLPAFLILVVAFGVYHLRGREMSMPSLFQPATGARLLMSMDGFEFTLSEGGKVSWRMSAEGADLYENREAQLKGVEIVYAGTGRGETALLGETGTLDTSSGNATIRRGVREVRVVTSTGYLLTTDSLSWKAGERLVRSLDPFKLLGREIYLEGRGLSADVDMRTVVVEDNVKAVLQE